MRAASRLILLAALVGGMVLAGCRPLSPPNTDDAPAGRSPLSLLSSQRMKHGSVALEVAVVTIPEPHAGAFESIWSTADRQFIDLATRQMLDRNGFRCAVLGTRLPGELTRILAWTPPLTGSDVVKDNRSLRSFAPKKELATRRLEQLQPGTEQWIPCSPVHEHLPWIVEAAGRRSSGVCTAATCGISVGLVSADDGTVRLWLRPGIMHGERRMRYGIDENDFLLEAKQAHLVLPELDFICRLLPGQTLMIASTPAPADDTDSATTEIASTTGASFFGAVAEAGTPARFLLIRPVQIQSDDLFQATSTLRRLATSLD